MASSSSSCLLDLKAELGKRKAAIKETKIPDDFAIPKEKFKLGKSEAKVKKTSLETKKEESNSNEDEEKLKKSRSMLEIKAKMYEGILAEKISTDDYDEDICLVNFNQKKKQNFKHHLKNFQDHLQVEKQDEPTSGRQIFSDEQKVGEDSGDAIHYQNVQFNEIRDHGVGYFAFSKIEAERQQQMKTLRDLRQQAEKRHSSHLEAKEKKKAALEARLSKICKRRHIDENVLIKDKEESESPDEKLLPVTVDLESIPLPDDVVPSESKKIRPWDIGKIPEGFMMKKKEQKMEKFERNEEFAPPESYYSNFQREKQPTKGTKFYS